ncbi:hypothetical protein CsSME_00042212 [Camellia sinensis var. sinensis]
MFYSYARICRSLTSTLSTQCKLVQIQTQNSSVSLTTTAATIPLFSPPTLLLHTIPPTNSTSPCHCSSQRTTSQLCLHLCLSHSSLRHFRRPINFTHSLPTHRPVFSLRLLVEHSHPSFLHCWTS